MKTRTLKTLVLVSVFLMAAGTMSASQKGLVAYYPFNEGQGDIAHDQSGKGNDGKIIGGTEWAKGAFGTALKLDGKDGYVDCGVGESLVLSKTGTISFWFKAKDVPQGGLVGWSAGEGNPNQRLVVSLNTYERNKGQGVRKWEELGVYMSDGKKFYKAHGAYHKIYFPPADQWIHFTVTFNGRSVDLYKDGVIYFTKPQSLRANTKDVAMWIGRCIGMGGAGDYFKGLLDEVRIYNRALSEQEVYAIYMKDAAGRVIYVGKAKNLRSRAASYFLKAAAEDQRTARLVRDVRDIDYLEAESEVDALLIEARLIKDILPKYNIDLRDDKSFPYLEIHTREEYPRVGFTREPKDRGTKLYGPFLNPRGLRGAIQVLQKIFRFRTCSLDISDSNERGQWFRPCLLHSIQQCSAPCNFRISKEEYRKDIRRLQKFLEGKRKPLLKEMRREMEAAAEQRRFEEAARLRDEIQAIESLNDRGELETHVQPEVFPIDPKKGLAGLQKVLRLPLQPRTIEGVDVAHLGGTETVAGIVQFIDGLPFKPGYRRMKIRSVEGIDDVGSIHEAVVRRFRHLQEENEPLPDILLIDGGKGQL
ncbi:hypothetical protein LCGC14_1891100, partial [marine sediment metagenome]